MMLRYSFDMCEEAELGEQAVQNVLASGLRTADIKQEKTAPVATDVIGDALLSELSKLTG